MATKPSSEPNKFIRLKKSIAGLHKDIAFLRKCQKSNVTPISHRIKAPSAPPAVIMKIEREMLKESIKSHYGKLNALTLECYALHLKLAKEFHMEFPIFLTKVKIAESCESERKRKLLDKKFKDLLSSVPHHRIERPIVQNIEGFVVNRSSQQFSDEQINLLNKGLNYAVTCKPDLEQIVIDVETAINSNKLLNPQINEARSITAKTIKTETQNVKVNRNELLVMKELKQKPVFYIKADKGNKIVVMDKEDYDNQMSEKIESGPYRKHRTDPLPDMIKNVDKTLKECKPVFGDAISNLKVSCPSLPRIKGLPKVHKPGNEMREIISAVGSPTHKISKWLVKEFQAMSNPFPSRSVHNTQMFTQELLNSGNISEGEIMVSFDVKALFPSVPVKEAISLLEDWLLSQHTGNPWKLKVRSYLKLTRLCMEENYFTFRGNYYKQLKGAPMGNPLAPFLSEIFMANLEQRLHEKDLLPKRWWRYVDDIFSIVDQEELPKVLETLNSAHKNIEFTHEIETEGKLPFLDVLVIRDSCSVNFEIYRKPTNTRRTIPNSSNHSHQHKMAAFHHMIHRMLTLPLSCEGQIKEQEYIFETGYLNGYPHNTIQNIINKKSKDLHKRSLTTLTPIVEPLRRVAIDFDQNITKRLRPKLEKFGLDLVFSSRKNQLQSNLGSIKDSVEDLSRSGVYKISCSHCDKVYIGQTKRTLETRFREHLAEVNKAIKETDKGHNYHFKSKVAEHVVSEEHVLTTDDIKTLRRIRNPWKLDVAESLEIHKQNPSALLNRDQGNGYSWLFKLLPKHRPVNSDTPPGEV